MNIGTKKFLIISAALLGISASLPNNANAEQGRSFLHHVQGHCQPFGGFGGGYRGFGGFGGFGGYGGAGGFGVYPGTGFNPGAGFSNPGYPNVGYPGTDCGFFPGGGYPGIGNPGGCSPYSNPYGGFNGWGPRGYRGR